MGVPDERELLEQKAARDCLTTMINECKHIFMVNLQIILISPCQLFIKTVLPILNEAL